MTGRTIAAQAAREWPSRGSTMRNDFIEVLEKEGLLPSERLEWLRLMRRPPAEPIGSIAFSHGMLTGDDVDQILDRQKQSRQPFGQIAVEMGILDDRQITRLLEIQRLRSLMATAEAMILTGMCPTADVMSRLGRFLAGRYAEAAIDEQSALRTGTAAS
jgi:hypothetical protein